HFRESGGRSGWVTNTSQIRLGMHTPPRHVPASSVHGSSSPFGVQLTPSGFRSGGTSQPPSGLQAFTRQSSPVGGHRTESRTQVPSRHLSFAVQGSASAQSVSVTQPTG